MCFYVGLSRGNIKYINWVYLQKKKNNVIVTLYNFSIVEFKM